MKLREMNEAAERVRQEFIKTLDVLKNKLLVSMILIFIIYSLITWTIHLFCISIYITAKPNSLTD